MTAINVLLQREAGHLVTDAAWYDLDGVAQNFAPKSQAIGHWPGAIAVRGPGLANAMLATEAGLIYQDIDDFAGNACQFLAGWCERNQDDLSLFQEQRHVELIALGWSNLNDGPRAIHVSSRDDQSLAQERGLEFDGDRAHLCRAFELIEIETGYVKPMPSEDALQHYRVDPGADFDALPSILEYGTGIICAQRELREPILPGGDPVCFVGGYVMHTVVTRSGVTMTKGAIFPDTTGERIEATRDDVIRPGGQAGKVVALPSTGLSRQQRRAAAAQARKGQGHAA